MSCCRIVLGSSPTLSLPPYQDLGEEGIRFIRRVGQDIPPRSTLSSIDNVGIPTMHRIVREVLSGHSNPSTMRVLRLTGQETRRHRPLRDL